MSFSSWIELIASGLITGGIYALVALGLNLQYGLMRILNIAHGEFLMVGAFITWMAAATFGLSPLWMIPVSFALLMGIGVAVHWLCFRRLTATSPNLDVFEARGLMVAFGLMFFVQNAISWIWGGDLRGYDFLTQPFAIPLPDGQAQFAVNKLLVFGLALLFAGALIVLLRTTLLGKGVRALMQSPTGAQLVGIDTKRLHPLMFGIGLGLSGVAGCLLSMAYTISPSMGEPYTVTALIVITLGGFGSMGGALAGGLLLGVIEAIGMHFTNPSLKALLSYIVFIGVLLLRPEGLFSRKTRKA
ncbi:MAG: branched-chain amino acid ABC transporter permease [Hydrogenophaga sp.]|jgi:branched-chain amino acid transport system permease protein|uniref:branched-chain amino acid ABC transporter permease n=1 Tax=Hydrogenophaga sp. TaxID=1904254 RepID=UPI0016ADED95|nr:branched-chain amino acid ABC transporter permease [Hydrogenophaga sp.]NIM39689.1 branched-chain amino acid ABC transporter permease [Hydrogenophaga sp.]NIN24893.1 branched-chain amino acid ABC transporter permease [Hydrogenophaga sp.]NIN29405.1 branched-chain amino acid ABC transporter permease [Hydrogenophaga sp.]NIN53928.1 branched-chain amino acid ABC transporter permease [Hydrogenophaga sp.]NIO50132.1 branched-chain amino acid ABC transporter permease [Hydrogenophaga sp.]